MKSSRNKLLGVGLLLLFLVPLGMTVRKVYREIRQPELNANLIAAIKKNDAAAVVALLAQGADANSREIPPDSRSAWRRLWDILRGQSFPKGEGRTTLLVALETNGLDESPPENMPLVTALLNAGASVNVSDEQSNTPLILAANTSKLETVRLLLQRRAEVNERNAEGYTPLFCAASVSQADTVRLLLAKGAHVNDRTTTGSTPLLIASLRGQVDIVRMILASGGDVNVHDHDGNCPLSYAMKSDNPEGVKLLLEYGARVEKNAKGRYTQYPWQTRHAAQILQMMKAAALQQEKAKH